MKIIDITRPLSNSTVVYPGDTPPVFAQHDQGQYLISDLCMNSHSGTHIDAPVHYLKTGDTIDTISLSRLVGPCRVLDVSHAGREISESVIKGKLGGTTRIILKTAFSKCTTFRKDYPSMTLDAARYLIKNGVQCVGIDSFSIEAFICDGAVHRELLGNNCVIIELLDLSPVTEGDYTLVALPLRLSGLDGSPARVILLQDEVHI
ncbi:cyclase family protein [Methanoregula sp.]|jgi:arylformamidase|uniref:cyclase family protein n=1 Tax=Methanoregula sp. TaxID=2052170 RepID=UPI003C1FE330